MSARLWPLALISLAGCPASRVTVAIDSVSATVPADFVPMDEERVEALREAAKSASADVDVSMVGRRPPRAPLPWMYLQRSSMRPTVPTEMLVGDVLEATAKELRSAFDEGGLEVVSLTSSTTDDSHELCFITRAKRNPKALNHACSRLWVSRQAKVVTASVVCLSTLDEPNECQRVLESRRVTPTDAVPRARTFGAVQR